MTIKYKLQSIFVLSLSETVTFIYYFFILKPVYYFYC